MPIGAVRRIDRGTHDRTHGIGVFIVDSLLNPRLAVGLSYNFFKGAPKLRYLDSAPSQQTLALSHLGHEAGALVSISAAASGDAVILPNRPDPIIPIVPKPRIWPYLVFHIMFGPGSG